MNFENYLKYAKMDEVQRLNLFLQTSLKSSSPKYLASSVRRHELGFAVDYMKLDSNSAIKKQLVNKTPILSLNSVYRVFYPEQVYDSMGDTEFRKMCANTMYTDQVIYSAMQAGVNIDSEISSMWKTFLTKVVLNPNTVLPQDVSRDLFDWVVQKRCKQEASFLKKTNKSILRQILSDTVAVTGVGDQILNSKQDLCVAVTDLNTMSRQKTNTTIQNCIGELNKYTAVELGLDKAVYDEMKAKFLKLQHLVESWDDVNTYYTKSEYCSADGADCTTNVKRLHVIAAEIERAANSCSSEISKLYKNKVVERRKSGDKSLTMYQRLKSYF